MVAAFLFCSLVTVAFIPRKNSRWKENTSKVWNLIRFSYKKQTDLKIIIMCRIGVFRLPEIQKFVAERRKSVYFTVEQRLSKSVSFETQLTSDIDVMKTEIKRKIPK